MRILLLLPFENSKNAFNRRTVRYSYEDDKKTFGSIQWLEAAYRDGRTFHSSGPSVVSYFEIR